MRAVSPEAIDEVIREFKQFKTIQGMVNSLTSLKFYYETNEWIEADKLDEAKEAAEKALMSCPIGSTEKRLQQVLDQALLPYRQVWRERLGKR